jgi:hypothetical protein
MAAGYISSGKRGNSITLTVEDKGWNWAGDHLRNKLPRNFQVLQDLLARLHQHLEKSEQTLAEFIGSPSPEQGVDILATRVGTRKAAPRSTNKKPKPPSAPQLSARIEDAYLAVTGGRTATEALLSKVRAELADLDRATVDAGLLRILQEDKKARLIQISDPKAISQEEREAAFSPGGEPFHILWIQP